MSKYEEKITDNSLWYTATPTPLTLTLPFYITEAGHFRAEADYKVERDEHDSYLLLYTIKRQRYGCERQSFFDRSSSQCRYDKLS